VPLLFLADAPGYMIGTQVERQGIIRSGAKMISAVSEATVPKISVIVRKAYGAGLYAMAGPAFDPARRSCARSTRRRSTSCTWHRSSWSTPSWRPRPSGVSW
jgi:acetyl-CoA carboxylase carboxyltransferase component